jgi:holo-[acyl-carrier protein] synthase
MLLGLGTDIIEIDRVVRVIERYGQKYLDRMFTKNEQDYCLRYRNPNQHYAARFAAKEAVVKALGTGIRDGITWTDIEIINDQNGKPQVYLSPEIRKQFGDPVMHLSMSHCKQYATAVAILESH